MQNILYLHKKGLRMLEIITDYLEILSYLALFGAISALANNLIHKRLFSADCDSSDKLNSSLAQSLNERDGSTSGTTAKVASSSHLAQHLNLAQDTRNNELESRSETSQLFKIILFYILSALIGATISAGIYLLCEVVFFLPFYVQIPLSVLCAYFAFDIVFALKSARTLYKSLERLPIPMLDVRLISGGEFEYMLLDSISVGEVSVPKNFVFRGFRRYFLLRYICPSDSTTIGAFMVAEYMEDSPKKREMLLSILLSKKSIFATILAFVCYVFVSVRHKEG